MLEQTRTPTHNTRSAFDMELQRAGIVLSPFPFERTFDSFQEQRDVILYRCISGDFNPRVENKDWSLNPQHALEYTSPVSGATNTLLIIQMSKVALCQAVDFYSKQGNKIGLKEAPDPNSIAKTRLGSEISFINADLLRCMRQVIRFGVNPDNSMDRGFSGDFRPEDLKFKSVLYEWQMGVSMAASESSIMLSPEVENDYNHYRLA